MTRDRFAPPPMPEGWPSAPRSMAPTLAKLDSLPRPQADSRPDYRLGYSHGQQAAYRNAGYIATALIAVGVVAWVIG